MCQHVSQAAHRRLVQAQSLAEFQIPDRLVVGNEGQQDADGLLNGAILDIVVLGELALLCIGLSFGLFLHAESTFHGQSGYTSSFRCMNRIISTLSSIQTLLADAHKGHRPTRDPSLNGLGIHTYCLD